MVLYTAGQRIRGSEINALPQLYRVTTAQTCNNDTALRDLAGLAFAADANAWYLVECFLAYHAHESGDIKFAWAPAGLFVQGDNPQYTGSWWSAQGLDPIGMAGVNGSPGLLDAAINATLTGSHARSGDNSVPVLACPVAFVQIGATAGTVRLQWAQQTAFVHPTTIRTGSCMRVSRLA
jgi:hypothetical protein